LGQLIIHTNQIVSPINTEKLKGELQRFTLEPTVEIDNVLKLLPAQLAVGAKLLSSPHSTLVGVHSVKKYTIHNSDGSGPVAFVLHHEAPKKFTAADMFRYIWMFKLDSNASVESVVHWIFNQNHFNSFPIQTITAESLSNSPDYKGPCQSKPAFWTFTPKDEIGTQISTMARAVYTILKKYGALANDGLMRLC
jgi:hypothetical protein